MRTVWRFALRGWRRLTSMRTALILLFLLAVAAVPGSLLPQRPLNPGKTQDYIDSHGAWGNVLNALGMFDVFGSPWFAAIYLLLFISLVGCLIPRIRVHARAVARKPLPAPRNLDRLPESGSFETGESAQSYATAARQALGRRWRVEQRDEPSGAVTLSAEKGYSRETGNLLFHVALLISLVLIAVGRLYNYQGTTDRHCRARDSATRSGNTTRGGRGASPPRARSGRRRSASTTWPSSPRPTPPTGEPSKFAADLVYRPTVDSKPEHATISVNHPLRIQGDRVYLIGHGFAPELTVHMPDGTRAARRPRCSPRNDRRTLLSEGVFKVPGPIGANQDIGVSGLFAPTPAVPGHDRHLDLAAGQRSGAGDQGLSRQPERPRACRSRSTRWTRPR